MNQGATLLLNDSVAPRFKLRALTLHIIPPILLFIPIINQKINIELNNVVT
jgi:hypothetical protein